VPETDVDANRNVHPSLQSEQLLAQLTAAGETVKQLTAALDSNRDIGAAVGILMAFGRLTQQRAFDLLRQASRSLNIKLRDVALEVIHTGQLPGQAEPSPVRRPSQGESIPENRATFQSRVEEAIRMADLRDAAALARSAASRARGRAAMMRHEFALLREAGGDRTVNSADRQCDLDDRNAEAIDNLWTHRDGDAAANDRALLSEASKRVTSS
jgi:hypothetical protein